MKKIPELFSNCSTTYEKANIILFGNPFDAVGGVRTGAAFAPDTIRRSSLEIDTYSFYQNRDLKDYAICDLGNTETSGMSHEGMLKLVETETHNIIVDGKIPVLLGGHPLTTLGSVRALYQEYPRMNIIYFGSHASLKEKNAENTILSQRVMKECYELIGEYRIHQFCVRSGSKAEFKFAAKHVDIHPLGFEWLQPTVDQTKQKNIPIYLSLNLDCLDPALFPAVENPVANGISFLQLVEAIQRVCTGNVVGADITGLLPSFDHSGACAYTASLIIRELLLALSRTF